MYVSYACPWAHRTLIYRQLKDLQDHITLSVVHPDMLDYGWSFNTEFPETTGDNLYNYSHLYKIYQKSQSDVSTSVTVPILWDKKTHKIVNNESSEIIRFFNKEFNKLTGNNKDYYPVDLKDKIDQINEKVYENINNGVYKSGFARSQEAYEEAIYNLFKTLDWLEQILEKNKYILGDQITEADIRLIPTLLRFDLVYYIHFKCTIRKISEYKNLYRYTKDLYSISAITKTTKFCHIIRHYYFSHKSLNPNRIIPQVTLNF